MQDKEKNSIEYISFASVISSIAVVYLHTNNCFWRFDADAGYWFSANIIETLFYFAVPVFFMIPGVTLLDFYDRYTLREYLAKRIRKTVIPYVSWSLIGLIYQIYVLETVNAGDVNPRYVVNGLFNGSLVSVYWFFIPLFSVYLSIPLFALVPKEHRGGIFRYLVAAGFLFNLFCPFIINVFDFNLSFPMQVSAASGYLIYIMVGWLIQNEEISRKVAVLIYILAVIGGLVHATGTYYVSTQAGEVLRTFKGYLVLPCVLYSIGVFLLIRRHGEAVMRIKPIRTIVDFLRPYTFAIYLLHVFVLRFFTKVIGVDDTSLFFRLTAPWIIIAITVVITMILRKIPLIRKLLPT